MRRALSALLLLAPALAVADEAPVVRLVGRMLGATPLLADLRELCDGIGRLDISGPASISLTGYDDRLRMHCLLAQGKRRP